VIVLRTFGVSAGIGRGDLLADVVVERVSSDRSAEKTRRMQWSER
jgi:hypothetical protein